MYLTNEIRILRKDAYLVADKLEMFHLKNPAKTQNVPPNSSFSGNHFQPFLFIIELQIQCVKKYLHH